MKKLKIFLRHALPPFFFSILKILQGRKSNFFTGNYKTWNDSLRDTEVGYESNITFEKVYKASVVVKQGKASYERDGICFYKENFRWPVVSLILLANKKIETFKHFHVVDFGGSLGSFYNQHKKLLSSITNLRWSIIEQEHFVKKGKEEFENNTLKFYNAIDECKNEIQPNLVLFSSSIQYLEKPYEILQQLILANPEFFIIDRTPFTNAEYDFVKLQHLTQEMGGAKYPSWFFSERRFLDFFHSNGYEEFISFECDEDFGVGTFKGIVLHKINNPL